MTAPANRRRDHAYLRSPSAQPLFYSVADALVAARHAATSDP
jgi:hypothetical protein